MKNIWKILSGWFFAAGVALGVFVALKADNTDETYNVSAKNKKGTQQINDLTIKPEKRKFGIFKRLKNRKNG